MAALYFPAPADCAEKTLGGEMISRMRTINAIALALLSFMPVLAAGGSIDFEEKFRNLQRKVQQLRPDQATDIAEQMEKAKADLADCPAQKPTNSRVIIGLDDVVYAYTSIDIPGGQSCIYIDEPLWRPLSAQEARDFSDALMMREIPHFYGGRATSEELAERASRGELHLAELLSVVARSPTVFIDPTIARDAGIRELGDLSALSDCSSTPVSDLQQRADEDSLSSAASTVYNDYYTWNDIHHEGLRCIFMTAPIHRGLTVGEAQGFLRATHMDLGFSREMQDANPGIESSDPRRPRPSAELKKKGSTPGNDNQPSALENPPNSAYPINTAAVLNRPSTGPGITASAVQVGAYVYITAAHTVINPANNRPYDGFRVRPAHRLPSVTNYIPVDILPDPNYTLALNQVRGRDLATLRASGINSRTPAIPIRIRSSADTGGGTAICASSQQETDAFWLDVNQSWYNPTGQEGDNDCFRHGPERFIVHYPNLNLANVQDPYPYYSGGVGIFGTASGGQFRQLRYGTGDGKPVIGLTNAYVTPGSSGAGVFATPFGSVQGSASRLLGIVLNQQGTNGYAAGDMDYNHSDVWTNLNWSPNGSGITITSPTEGSTYDSQAVPNLVATAGSQTSQLRWSSSIDGHLGQGGNVSVQGRLSAGFHTISATIGAGSRDGESVQGPAADPVRTLHITVTGSPTPQFSISPTTVLIPATATSGPFTYSWHVAGHTSLGLQSKINNGAWAPVPPLSVPASHTTGATITVGTTYQFRFMPPGSSTVLGTLSVSGVAAPAPVFVANPTHIVTNGANGLTRISWNAPGYDAIDWCGRVNSPVWQCGSLSTGPVGFTDVSVPVGSTYGYRFYPHGSPNQGGNHNLLGELTVDCVNNSPPTFTANPAHVIVPPGGTSGNTIIIWSAPAYASIDWCGKINSDPWTWAGLSTPSIGKTTMPVPLGTTYGFRFYAPGGAAGCPASTKLGELTVYATH